jgi:ribosome maturation protein Sdo1
MTRSRTDLPLVLRAGDTVTTRGPAGDTSILKVDGLIPGRGEVSVTLDGRRRSLGSKRSLVVELVGRTVVLTADDVRGEPARVRFRAATDVRIERFIARRAEPA